MTSRTKISSKNTAKEANNSLDDDELNLGEENYSKSDSALRTAQTNFEKERDLRREERWYWTALMLIGVDLHFFVQIQSWTAPIVIVVLQLIVLLVLARKWGVDMVELIFIRMIDAYSKRPKE